MAEYINRAELIENLNKFAPEHFSNLIKTLIEKQPSADVEEVKHGYWKHSVEFGFAAKYHYWNCSVCGVASEDEGKEKYCRECGAKMDGGKEE